MGNIFRSDKEVIKGLKANREYLVNRIVELEDIVAGNDIANKSKATTHRLNLAERDNQIAEMKATMGDKVAKDIAQSKKDLKIRGESQEREHVNRLKALEKEYVEKLARVDRKLEEDKSSYRKYLKQEFNTKIEGLEKTVERLQIANATLQGANTELEKANGILEGNFENISDNLANVIKALPTVSATVTTPESHVHVEPARATGGGQKN